MGKYPPRQRNSFFLGGSTKAHFRVERKKERKAGKKDRRQASRQEGRKERNKEDRKFVSFN